MQHRCWSAVAILAVSMLPGCALNGGAIDAKADVASSSMIPVKSVTLVIGFESLKRSCPEMDNEYSGSIQPAMLKRIPEIFAANGIPVTAVKTTLLNRYQRTQSGRLTLPELEFSDGSHALVLLAESIQYAGSTCSTKSPLSIKFDARLWETSAKRQVWSATPSYQVVLKQPLLRSQNFAGSLILGMAKTGVIQLKQGRAVDAAGATLTDHAIWETDK